MAKSKPKTAAEIVKEAMPGYHVVEAVSGIDAPAAPDATTPDLDALRQKFLGPAYRRPAPDVERTAGEAKDDVEIVWVQPKDSVHGDPQAVPKAVVVSKSKQIIIGKQG